MKDNNKQWKPARLIITGMLCMVLVLTIVPRAKSIIELSARKKELEKEKLSLVRINTENSKELQELKSPEAMERIAREQLGMIKKGERVVVEVMSHN